MEFAVDVFKFCRKLPETEECRDIVRQLRRSASSVGSNCRAAKRSQSDAVFVSKTATVIEEADESGFWLELLVEIEIVGRNAVGALLKEANELVAIFTTAKKKTQARMEAEKARRAEERRRKRKA